MASESIDTPSDESAACEGRKMLIIHFNDVCTCLTQCSTAAGARDFMVWMCGFGPHADNVNSRQKEPVGGAARLKAAFDSYASDNPLVLFSGDCLSPSVSTACCCGPWLALELVVLFTHTGRFCCHGACCRHPASLHTKGHHMADVLHQLGVQAACIGNHGAQPGAGVALPVGCAAPHQW